MLAGTGDKGGRWPSLRVPEVGWDPGPGWEMMGQPHPTVPVHIPVLTARTQLTWVSTRTLHGDLCRCDHTRACTDLHTHTAVHRHTQVCTYTHTDVHSHTHRCAHTPEQPHSPSGPSPHPRVPHTVPARTGPTSHLPRPKPPPGTAALPGLWLAPGRPTGWFSPPGDVGQAENLQLPLIP